MRGRKRIGDENGIPALTRRLHLPGEVRASGIGRVGPRLGPELLVASRLERLQKKF